MGRSTGLKPPRAGAFGRLTEGFCTTIWRLQRKIDALSGLCRNSVSFHWENSSVALPKNAIATGVGKTSAPKSIGSGRPWGSATA
ncbi:hypothetical protein [Primorskyibacter sp. S187A]|uniref:hypothetical protein n=1 Tax=Primorskyibacter sp. S187A TaxID=3415130 RepID=UPI003C7C18B8